MDISNFLCTCAVLVMVSCKPTPPETANVKINSTKQSTSQQATQSLTTNRQLKSFKAADITLTKGKTVPYAQLKKSILQTKSKAAREKISEDSLSLLFTELLLNKVIPYWYGTQWSFEGHTEIPRQGSVACGYFVSTTLRDLGIRLNRYRLAQQSPVNEAKSLSLDAPLIIVEGNSNNGNIRQIEACVREGIHFIGFDQSHVSYLIKKEGELFLVHSNYLDAKGVEIEKIEASEVFASYSKFYIVALSTNKVFLNHWITNKELPIITN